MWLRVGRWLLGLTLLAGAGMAVYHSRDHWLPWVQAATPADAPEPASEEVAITKVIVNEAAQKNLGLVARPIRPETFWKTISVPGMVVDRPGLSDRGVVAPVTGVISAVHHVPGDTVRPGDPLFTVKLLSESLHLTQTDLFKTAQDIKLAHAQRKRMAAASGVIPEARIIEVDAQIKRLEVAEKAYRQELLNRGLAAEAIDGVTEGKFVAEIVVAAPKRSLGQRPLVATLAASPPQGASDSPPVYELQELKVDLGQQVQAGQTLCLLANHQSLSVEGKAFRDEVPLLERTFKEGWPVEADFEEGSGAGWGLFRQTLAIRHIANSIDPAHRTFAFFMPLENESRAISRDGKTQLLWRFRPGQKVRLLVRVEKLDNVFVVPADAVVRDGAEAFVFTQNDDTFERRPVRLVLVDRRQAVVANDGALLVGSYVAQGAATQLNRMIRAGSQGGVPKGYHIHADGSLHKNDDHK
ncbi:MAG: hypothetical protein U0840_00695 [Gemmataceae bacterium]